MRRRPTQRASGCSATLGRGSSTKADRRAACYVLSASVASTRLAYQHMQKALTEMNSSSTTSSRHHWHDRPADHPPICGERDPEVLARLRHYSCHSAETIAKALTGSYRRALCARTGTRPLRGLPREGVCLRRADEAVLKELSIDRGHRSSCRARRANDQANGLASMSRGALRAAGKDITRSTARSTS